MYNQGNNYLFSQPCYQPKIIPIIAQDSMKVIPIGSCEKTRVFNCKTSDVPSYGLVKGDNSGSRFIKQLVAGQGISISEGDCSLIISDNHLSGFVDDVENTASGIGLGKLVVPEGQPNPASKHPKIKSLTSSASGGITNGVDDITILFPEVRSEDSPGVENEFIAVREHGGGPTSSITYGIEFLAGVFEDLPITNVGSSETDYILTVYESSSHGFFETPDRDGLRQLILIRGWYFTVEERLASGLSFRIKPFPAYNSPSDHQPITLKKKDWIHFLEPVSTIVGGKHATRAIGMGTKKSMYPYIFNAGPPTVDDVTVDVENTLGQKITVSHNDTTTLRIPAPTHKLAAVGQSFDIITVNGDNPEDTGNLQSCLGNIIIELKPEDSLIYSGTTTTHITQFVVKPVVDNSPTAPTNEMGITSHLRFTYDYRLRTDPVLGGVNNTLGWRMHSLFLGTDWVDHLDGYEIPSWSDTVTSPPP